MFVYEKKLQYPVRIANPNPKLAAFIISQYGGPDGELGASLRYLSQRYTMPYPELKALLTDIGVEELGHLEMVGTIVHQLTRSMTEQEVKDAGYEAYFVDHTAGVYPTAASGFPWNAASMAVKGDLIADLTEDCGISRMAFYYHFKDIYDLVEWACVEDGKKALRDKKTYDTWQEGFAQIFEAVLENKPFIMNVYHSVNHEKIESFLYKLTYQLIADVVEEKCSRDHLPETDKQFIADFYKYGFVGIMLDWIDRGMKEDYQKIVDLLAVTLHGNIANSIRNFEQVKEKI